MPQSGNPEVVLVMCRHQGASLAWILRPSNMPPAAMLIPTRLWVVATAIPSPTASRRDALDIDKVCGGEVFFLSRFQGRPTAMESRESREGRQGRQGSQAYGDGEIGLGEGGIRYASGMPSTTPEGIADEKITAWSDNDAAAPAIIQDYRSDPHRCIGRPYPGGSGR